MSLALEARPVDEEGVGLHTASNQVNVRQDERNISERRSRTVRPAPARSLDNLLESLDDVSLIPPDILEAVSVSCTSPVTSL